MKAEELKLIIRPIRYIFPAEQITPEIVLSAWVDLNDCLIYHAINGELMALTFPTLDAFANHIEQITEP